MKVKILTIVSIVILSSCNNYKISSMNKIEGNGKIIEKKITISDITSIENSGIFDIYIKQGEQEELKIETDEDILPFLIYKINGSSLSFSMKKGANYYKPTKTNIYLTVKDIKIIDN